MNTIAAPASNAAVGGAQSPAGGSPPGCFCSITLWQLDGYYLEVNYGYFPTWQEAEAFSCETDIALSQQLGALFVHAAGRDHFVPDAALQIFQKATNSKQFRSTRLDLDDLFELFDVEDMQLAGIGHAVVEAGRPIQVRPLNTLPAANDDY